MHGLAFLTARGLETRRKLELDLRVADLSRDAVLGELLRHFRHHLPGPPHLAFKLFQGARAERQVKVAVHRPVSVGRYDP